MILDAMIIDTAFLRLEIIKQTEKGDHILRQGKDFSLILVATR